MSPGLWPDCRLTEFPLTTLSVLGQRLPVCGGGYMRLLPAAMHARAISRQSRAGHPAVIYLHPFELAPGEVATFKQAGVEFSRKREMMQSLHATWSRMHEYFVQASFREIRRRKFSFWMPALLTVGVA